MDIELIAPVGNFEMLTSAINAGADAVYLGIQGSNMRASAANFKLNELAKVTKQAHDSNVRVYLTLNTIIFEDELKKIDDILDAAKKAGVDAVIAWDLAVIKNARDKGFEVHLSTQASASNSVAINEYKKLGVTKVVLARECTLEEIQKISEKTEVVIEAFVHGSMCVAESGRCFLSEFIYGKSANRGECIQPCRREYIIKDKDTGKELLIGNNYVMSAKDLCTVTFLDKIINAGVKAFKIEGRGKTPEYVYKVVRVYKKALDCVKEGALDKHKKEFENELKEVYNRGFSSGFYFGRPIEEFWDKYGGQSKFKKEYVGDVINYYPKAKAFHASMFANKVKEGDSLLIIGPTTGVVQIKVKSIRFEDKTFTVACKEKVRQRDKVYKKVKNDPAFARRS